ADSETERQHHARCEAGRSPNAAECVARILSESIEQMERRHTTNLLSVVGDISQRAAGGCLGFGSALRLELAVEAKLTIDFARVRLAAEHDVEAMPKRVEERHLLINLGALPYSIGAQRRAWIDAR